MLTYLTGRVDPTKADRLKKALLIFYDFAKRPFEFRL